MKQILKYLNRLLILLLITLADHSYGQLKPSEHIINITQQVRKNIEEFLTANEKEILSKVKVEVKSEAEYKNLATATQDVNGNKLIIIGEAFIKKILFSISADLITEIPEFKRKRFNSLYASMYDYIDIDNYTPVEVAALDSSEKDLVFQILFDSDAFSCAVYENFRFIYLHELGHHFLNHKEIKDKLLKDKLAELSRKKPRQNKLDEINSKLKSIELAADYWAFSTIDKFYKKYSFENCPDLSNIINLRPSLLLFELSQEDRGVKSEILPSDLQRETQLLQFAKNKYCTALPKDTSYCDYIDYLIQTRVVLEDNYKQVLEDKENYKNNIYTTYNIADAYIKGQFGMEKNVDSALYYYKYASDSTNYPNPENNNWYGMGKNRERAFLETIEYCRVLSAFIYEYIKNNKVEAVQYFKLAATTNLFFDADFYVDKISSLEK